MFNFILVFILPLSLSSCVVSTPVSAGRHELVHVYRRSVDMDLPFYYPDPNYDNNPVWTGGSNFSGSDNSDPVAAGIQYMASKLNVDQNELKVYNRFTDASGTVHIYGAQAAKIAAEEIGVPYYSSVEITKEYVHLPGGNIVYAYMLQLRDGNIEKWLQAWVDAHTGQVIHSIDFSNDFSYKVIDLPGSDPRDGFSLVKDPEFKASSPEGWTTGTQTIGNNVNARDQRSGSPGRGSNGVFDSNHNPDAQPTTPENTQTSAVNLFYIGNFMHDFSYQYGFTEANGNFQKDNFGKGGRGNDAVTINVLSTSGTNNANFLSPADGQAGIMNMFQFTKTNPRRDGGLENVISIHEYVHGISNRLTGGSATGQCLSTKEAGGMGEGWSDFVALVATAKKQSKDITPISVGSDLQRRNEVHDIGEVWTIFLWEVYWNLVNKNGFSENLFDAKQSAGNIVAMQLVMGGLMNQPCNPTFLTARDAILKADDSFYKGANKCDIIKGFARRGLGLGARNRIDDFSVPAECGGSGKNIPPPVPTGDNDGASKLPTDQSGDDNDGSSKSPTGQTPGDDNGGSSRLPTTGQTPGGGTNRTGRGGPVGRTGRSGPVGRTGRGGPVGRTGRGGPVDRTGRGRGPIGPRRGRGPIGPIGRGPRRGRLTSRLGAISRLGGSFSEQVSQMLKEFESDK
ncbi:hypothetical protein BASA50_001760 [Batrachochytrium salamandrivorans]|uniref:Extracellular metalloproteinase n=1 Tax=Batrachochytrium salamandrivorans TaxID=1357716 RepID=A0ABQ8FPP5_9FUNG|nr:hypothetical protein BASA50_001760 [Batrachochytrium salamandrivorans]